MHQVIVQGIGYIALAFVLLSFQRKQRVQILVTMLVGVSLFVLHYSLLHAWTGALMNFIEAGITFIAFKKEDKQWATSRLWLVLFIGLYIGAAILTVRSFISVLPVLAQVAGAIAVWQTNARAIRFIMLIPRPLWLIYNATVGSQAGIVAEVCILISVLSGIIRFDVLDKRKLSARTTELH